MNAPYAYGHSLFAPIAHVERIDKATLNRCLVDWGHKMGPWNRPDYGRSHFHALFNNGDPVAVAVDDQLVSERVAGLARSEAIELGRLCAKRRDLNRVMLRLWREFVFPTLGVPWAVSYQDAVLHSGDVYRFDGWTRLGTSRSGTDARSGRTGRSKVIWGWKLPQHHQFPSRDAA